MKGSHRATYLLPLQDHGHTLSASDAHADQGTLGISTFEFIQSGHGQPQTRHSHRMAERDRTAVWIQIVMRDFAQPLGPSISAELAFHKSRRVKNAHDPQHHGCKGFVDLTHCKILEG